MMAQRECGTCTKCCEGWLSGEIHGAPLCKGSPCKFIENSKCGIYENRPESPCRTFNCEWVKSEDFPEYMKPDVCNVIISKKSIGSFSRYEFVKSGQADESVIAELVSWATANAVCHVVV